MIVTLSGITGAGKSYYKKTLISNLGLKNMVIYTTREKRKDEVEGIDKHFVKRAIINEKMRNGSLFAAYEFLGEIYGYDSKYLKNDINSVTELHYEWIIDFKQKVKDIFSIYIIPTNIEIAKKELQKRGLPEELYKERIKEIEEHQKRIKKDKILRDSFDFVFYNNYDTESAEELIKLVKSKLNNRKKEERL